MKTKYLFAVLCATMATPAIAQTGEKKMKIKNDPDAFMINGTLKNFVVQPSKVYLFATRPDAEGKLQQKVEDSTMVKDGKFGFSGTVSEVTAMQIGTMKTMGMGGGMLVVDRIQLEVMPGTINVVADKKFGNNKLSGSGATATIDYRTAMKRVTAMGDSARELMQSEEAKTNPAMAYVFSNALGEMMNAMMEDSKAFIKSKPASPIAPKLLDMIISSDQTTSESDDSLIQMLPAAAREKLLASKKTAIGKKKETERLKREAEALTALGVEAKDFTQKDVNGKSVKLSDFKGKYVLIDFWASWCGPCRAENPNVVKAYNTYKDKNFDILGVSLDLAAQEDAWKSAIRKDGLIWTQVWDTKGFDNDAAKLYGVKSIPQNFLLDPSGKIIAKNLRGEDLEKKLAEVIK